MSNIKLSPNPSGTGSLTIAAPNTNSDVTFNLPTTLGNAGTSAFLTTDASGNAGLGVTPSAWGGSFIALELAGGAISGNSSNNLRLFQNSYFNGTNYVYKTTEKATRYDQQQGAHYWFTAPSGTAGNAISFTQAMTLSAAGGLSVGTTDDAGAGNIRIPVGRSYTTFNANYGIGTPDSDGLQIFTGDLIRFGSRSGGTFTERARIDSSGNLLVGQTSNTGLANSNSMIYFPGSLGAQYMSHASGSASGSVYIGFGYNTATIGSISQNGTTGVLYNLTSDYRLKNNPVPVTGAKEFINALQPKTWDWWDGSGKGVGFIAHEFMEVAKYSGNGTKDAVDDDGNPVYQSIQPSSSEVMANLVAYVQELRAEFDAYKAAHP